MTAVPIVPADPKAAYLASKSEIDAAIRRVLEGGRYILGGEVSAFEGEFASFVGAKHGIGVANGTDAIEVALRALSIGAGDIVATVSHTAVATVAAIERAGATPLLLDIDRYDTLDPEALDAAARQSKLKAVIPVHLYGQPAAMPEILAIAEKHGLAVIEDGAQAHGAKLGGKPLGNFGDAAAWSLYPTKNLGAIGDGGIATTSSADVARRMRQIREYGWVQRYISDFPGLNSRLDELQAAILRVKLARLAEDNGRRRHIAAAYDRALEGTGIEAPRVRPGAEHVYHLYVLRTPARDALKIKLQEAGIGSAIHYPAAVHRQPAYAGRVAIGPTGLSRTDALMPNILSLPMYPELTDAQVRRVCDALAAFSRRNSAAI
jgi:dTDP-4-amino-4,6-dideoxygalactose transaminase